MLGPFLLPFTGSVPPVAVEDGGADTTHSRRKYLYKEPTLHQVYFKSSVFEFSYSFSSFILKEAQKDCRVVFSSTTICISDSLSSFYVKDGFSSKSAEHSTSSLGILHCKEHSNKINFSSFSGSEVLKDVSKACFVLSMYDNRYDMEEEAILFHISINL